jgi:uncharacterized OB-fold protein
MDIPETIKKYTLKSLEHYGDSATKEFYERLKKHDFSAPFCNKCHIYSFPPRIFCPKCYNTNLEWKMLPDEGTLYAFTQQERALRFSKPDVIGIVELQGVGRILTKIAAPFETLRIGMRVKLDFIEIENGLVLHQFRPL